MGLSISAGTSDHQSSLEWDPKKLPSGTMVLPSVVALEGVTQLQ